MLICQLHHVAFDWFKSDKLTKISGRDLTTKFTRDIKKGGLSNVIYI